MRQHLVHGALNTSRGHGQNAQHHETQVRDRRVRNELLDVILGVSHERTVDDADHGQPRDKRRRIIGRQWEERHGEAKESVGTEFQQNRGQNDRAARRCLHVRVRQPRVQWKERHLNKEGEREGCEAKQLRLAREHQARPSGVVERPLTGEAMHDRGDDHDGGEHQQRAYQRENHELDGSIHAALAAPDANDEVHRHQHQLPEHVEREHVEREKRPDHAGFQHQHGGHEAAIPVAHEAGGLRRQQGHQDHQGRQKRQPQRDPVDSQVKTNAERGHPLPVGLHLEARLGCIEGSQHEERLREGGKRHRNTVTAHQARTIARQKQRHGGANQRQQGCEGKTGQTWHGYRISTSRLMIRRVCQRES